MERIISSVALILASILLGTALYWEGILRFSYPSEEAYPVRGIDVSHHQRVIDWNAVASGEIDFAYIKATEGMDWRDPRFAPNLTGASDAGLATGAYHFFTLCTPGRSRAENFIAAVPKGLPPPPVVDLEYGGNCAGRPASDAFQYELREFLNAVHAHYGRAPVIYTMDDFYDDYLAGTSFAATPLWFRDLFFSINAPRNSTTLFWQYGNRGRVPGIEGPVDLNVFTGTKVAFRENFNAARP